MTEDSGAFKTNPGDCAGFGHFVKVRESSGKSVLLPTERSAESVLGKRSRCVKRPRPRDIASRDGPSKRRSAIRSIARETRRSHGRGEKWASSHDVRYLTSVWNRFRYSS